MPDTKTTNLDRVVELERALTHAHPIQFRASDLDITSPARKQQAADAEAELSALKAEAERLRAELEDARLMLRARLKTEHLCEMRLQGGDWCATVRLPRDRVRIEILRCDGTGLPILTPRSPRRAPRRQVMPDTKTPLLDELVGGDIFDGAQLQFARRELSALKAEAERLRAKAALCDEIALDVKCQQNWLERYAALDERGKTS